MRKLLKISLVCAAGALVFTAKPQTALAYEEGVAGYVYDKDSSTIGSTSNKTTIISLSASDIPIPGYSNLAIADVETNLLIRSGPGENKKIIGKLPKDGACEVLEDGEDGWTKISAKAGSETLTGYAKSEYLLRGIDAIRRANETGSYVATANSNGLNVRGEPSTEASILDKIATGEELIVLDSKITTDNEEHNSWVKVSLDSDTEEGSEAYVAKEYVNITFELIHAVSMKELQYGSGVTSTRVKLVNEAKEHLGGRYVFGRATLGVAVDCSGFTQQLYKKLGYSIPRDSRSQARGGSSISSSQLKPGDLVFYGSSKYINHVAMYIGNGKVIHASNKRDGIKISNMRYRTPVKFARYIKD